MVPANKILTVAYGTFSCTLEGFDDPFSTMTDIAEYFRDLAAQDRYFGAEPPTPDMAMLRQIAETTSRQTVEAETDGGGVTLRPTEAPAIAATAAAVAADVVAAPEEDAVEAEDDAVDAMVETADAEQDAAAAVTEDAVEEQPEVIEIKEDDAESAAAKLARIRGVVEADRAGQDTYSEDEHANDTDGDGIPDMEDDTLAAAFADMDALSILETEDSSDEDDSTEDAIAETADEDAFDAELAAFFAEDDESDDETAASDEEDVTAEVETPAAEAADEAPVAEESPAEETTSEEASVEEQTQADAAPRRIRVRKVRRADAEAAATAAAATAAAEEVAAMAEQPEPTDAIEDSIDEQLEAALADDAGEEDDAEADLMAELAAIEAELGRDATGATAEASLDDEDEVAPEAADDDLMAELAAIRADETPVEDMVDEDDMNDFAALAEETTLESSEMVDEVAEESAPAEAIAEEPQDEIEDAEVATAADPEDLERLFAATDSRLSGEDTSRRHANISHLKAAVAARRADDTMETPKSDDTGAYREDLANTVRPRRAAKAAEGRTARPERPAPLVLVSEQRVEEEEAAAAPAAPVTPRRAPRVADVDESMEVTSDRGPQRPEVGDDFEQFAQDVGATDLADVLEAAAVYSATVMGQDNFSRPRLLHLAAEAVDDLSREDGLRGFGQLLRDGTLRKVSRGTFALGAESRFRDQAERRVG